MATVEKTVELIFEGIDQTSGVLRDITGNLGGLESAVSAVATPLARVADGVLVADAALAAMAAGGLALAFQASTDFETASIELQKVIGDQTDRLGEAETAATDLSNTYGVAATDILGSFANFVQAGFDLDDAMQLTRASLDLVIAGGLEADQASQLLVQTLSGFQAPAADANRILDILNATSNTYATSVEQLGAGMARLSPIADTMGFSFEETAGILTPVIEVFQSGEEAARAMRTGLLRMIDDSQPVKDALAQLGVSQTDVNGVMRSGRDIFFDVAAAFVDLDDNQKIFIASQLAGKDQAARFTAALNNLETILSVTDGAMQSAGSAAAEVEIRLGSTQVAVDRFQVGFTNLARVVGDEFRDAATSAVDGGTAIERALTDLVTAGAFDDLGDAVEDLLNVLGQFLQDVAAALPGALDDVDFDPAIDALERLGQAALDFFDGVDLTTPEGLATALQRAVDTISSLVDATHGIGLAFQPILDGILTAIDEFNQLSSADKIQIGEDFLGAAKLIEEAGVTIGLALVAIGQSGADMRAAFDVIIGAIEGTWETAKTTLLAAESVFVDQLNNIVAVVNTLTFGQIPWVDELEQSLTTLSGVVQDELLDSAQQAEDAWVRAGTGLTNLFDPATQAGGALDQFGAKAQDAATGADQVADSASSTETELAALEGALGDAADSLNAQIDAGQGAADAHANLGAALPATATGLQGVDAAAQRTATTLNESAQATETMRIKAMELEAQVRTAQLQMSVDLQVAQFEADTARIESAFQSITDVAGQTGDMITQLFQQLAGAQGSGNIQLVNQIQTQIQREEARRQQEFLLQRQLVQAQIDSLNIRNQILQQGGGLIQIDSTGLAPALEMVMWNIIEKVQLRVNASAAEFLLGIS